MFATQSLKNQKSTPSGCQDIGIRKFEFVAKTHFLTGKVEILHILKH